MLQLLHHVQLLATPLSPGFSRQEEWNGLPFPTPGNLPNPGIELASPASPALTGRFFTTDPPGKQDNDYFYALDARMVAYPL